MLGGHVGAVNLPHFIAACSAICWDVDVITTRQKLFPLWSTGDKVWQSWEVLMRRCWRGSRLYWFALSCNSIWWDAGLLAACHCVNFFPRRNTVQIYIFLDVSVSTLMISLRIPYVIRPAAANVLPLTGWPPSIPQISVSDCKTIPCKKRIFHAFVEQKNLSWICGISFRSIFVVQDVVLCFPGRWNWNRKVRRS